MAMLRVPRGSGVAQLSVAEFETAMRDFEHWIDKAMDFIDNRYGIGIVDRSCIELLVARSDGCRPREISEYLHLSVGETSALVSRLVRRGYARRERDPADPETVTVHAETGNNDVMAIVRARRALAAGVMQNFDPAELEVIARYANYLSSVHPARLIENAEQQVARKKSG
jgi:DNA-binding MarR family transcriptional regulator